MAKDPENRSYSDSMNEWAEKQSFKRRFRARAIGGEEAGWGQLLMGFAVRLFVLALILGGIAFFYLKSHISGQDFSDRIGNELGILLNAQSFEVEKIKWKGKRGLIPSFTAKGGEKAFYHEMKITRVRFHAGLKDLLGSEGLNLSNVEIGEAEIRLKAGNGVTEGDGTNLERRPDHWRKANPDLSKAQFKEVKLSKIKLDWGPYWTSEGSLNEGKGRLSLEEGQWVLHLDGGILSQNWLKDLTLTKLKVRKVGSDILLEDGGFGLGESGAGDLKGKITIEETPQLNLETSLVGCDIHDFLPRAQALVNEDGTKGFTDVKEKGRFDFFESITGSINMKAMISGSPNTNKGVRTDVDLSFLPSESSPPRLRDLPILSSLAIATLRSEFRLLPISEGRVRFMTEKGRMHVSDFRLRHRDAAILEGAFSYQMDTAKLEKIEIPDMNVARTLTQERKKEGFTGDATIKIRENLFTKYPSIAEDFFVEAEEGWKLLNVPLEGSRNQLTNTQSEEINAAVRILAKENLSN